MRVLSLLKNLELIAIELLIDLMLLQTLFLDNLDSARHLRLFMLP